MKIHGFILLILIQLISISLLSQATDYANLRDDFTLNAGRNMPKNLVYEAISGTPFYSKEFIPSTVYLKDGTYGEMPIRYDIYRDEFEFKKDGTTMWINKQEVKYIMHGTEIIQCLKDFKDPVKSSYYFVPDTGTNRLYIKLVTNFHDEVPPKGGYSDPIPPRFISEKDEYYLQLGESTPAKRIIKNKDLETLLANNGPALEFIKKEKIKTTSVESMLKLVAFLNKQGN